MAENGKFKYPVGIQTFSEIIENGYLYVDKTELIYNLIDGNKYVFLSRPRRFGKSLLVSTLESYFKGEKELFKGLAIENLEKEWIKYPVLRLDLSKESYDDPENLTRRLSKVLDDWEREFGITPHNDTTLSIRFEDVIRKAKESYGRNVVILIDEYDKPLLAYLHESERKEVMRQRLQGFYSVIKGCDEYIKFVLVTGVSKFAHLSIFSGFNNLSDISMLPKYDAICGISEDELHRYFGKSVQVFADNNGISEAQTLADFKKHYDGYHFSRKLLDIYNPFSVLKAFQDSEIRNYWFGTGTPSFLVKLTRRNNFMLLQLDAPERTADSLSDVTENTSDMVPLLFQAGYLTIKSWDPDFRIFTLGFPNEEVKSGFWNSFAQAYFPPTGYTYGFDVREFLRYVNTGETDRFMQALKALISSANSEHEPDKEIHFQNMMAIIFKMLGLYVRTEIHSARGRCDLTLETASFIYIFEFKINGSAQDALSQIEENGYANPFMADTRTKILIGADFSTELRTLTDWKIKTIP